MTFIYDLKIDLNTHEPHNDKFLFSETSPIVNSAGIGEKIAQQVSDLRAKI